MSTSLVAYVLFFSRSRIESIFIKSIRKEKLHWDRAEEGKYRARKKFENAHGKMSVVMVVTMVVVVLRQLEKIRSRGRTFGAASTEKRGRMLFRTTKLNYQIKQQRRYINKIDFARRSSKRKSRPGAVVSRLTSFRATPDLITLHD